MKRFLPIPPSGYDGVAALVLFGPEKVEKLAEAAEQSKPTLAIGKFLKDVSEQFGMELSALSTAVMQAIFPLNNLRRSSGLQIEQFVQALSDTINEHSPEDWRKLHLAGWKAVAPQVSRCLAVDGFFSTAEKSFELLSHRTSLLVDAKILSELRPVFSEDVSKILALLHTNTLVLRYLDEGSERTLHFALDDSDLATLAKELKRAHTKTAVGEEEAKKLGYPLLSVQDS